MTISGLVTDTTSATATIDDGTGEVRLGGVAIADALSILEPGDAIEVAGMVQQDGRGLLVEGDAESVIDVPGVRESAAVVDGDLAAPAHRPDVPRRARDERTRALEPIHDRAARRAVRR